LAARAGKAADLPEPDSQGAGLDPARAPWRDLLDALPDALVVVGVSGAILMVNAAAEAMFGYERAALVGAPLGQLVPDSVRALHDGLLGEFFAAEASRPMRPSEQMTGRRADGALFPADIALSHARSLSGPLVIAAVRDMTDYRAAESDRRRRDELTAIVEHSDDAIIATTLEGTVTSWNRAATRVFGFTPEDIVGRSVLLLSRSDRAAETGTMLDRVRSGRRTEHHETIRVRKDGAPIRVALTVSPVRDGAGVTVGASIIARDVTAAALAQGAARSMIESSLDSLVAIDAAGRITDVNEATVRVTGVPREQLIGTDFSGYFTDPDRATAVYRQAFLEGAATDTELTIRARDGALTDVQYNASVYRDVDDNVLGVFVAARDVTEARAAQQDATRLAAVVQFSGEAITSFTMDRIIATWNPAATALFGYTSAEIVGQHAAVMTPPEYAGQVDEVLAAVAAGRVVENFETERVRKDGTRFPALLTVAPIRDSRGAVVGASTITRDVSAARRAFAAAQQMAAIVDSSAEAIVAVTPAGLVTAWNPAAVALFGYTAAEMVGQPVSLLGPNEPAGTEPAGTEPARAGGAPPWRELSAPARVMARVMAGSRVERVEGALRRKDGTALTARLSLAPLFDQAARVSGVVAVISAVTYGPH